MSMKGLTVVTTVRYQGQHWQRLEQALDDAKLLRFSDADEPGFDLALETADVAIVEKDIDARFFHAPKLRWVHVDHAGLNKSAQPEALRSGLTITGSAGRSSPVLAEHALFFALALTYRFPLFIDAQRAHRWGVPGQGELRGLFGRTLGIVGLGHTGTELAIRGRAFGMRVLGYRRRVTVPPPGVDHVFSLDAGDSLQRVLEESDFVVLTLPLSDATKHLIGAKELDMIGPKGYLINMARGAIVDEAALVSALVEGRIAGAGLDTFTTEPLPTNSPLWDAPNVLITPHVTPAVPDRTDRSLDIICENIRRFVQGAPLLNRLTSEDVYSAPQTSAEHSPDNDRR